jgi:hypothetical protein
VEFVGERLDEDAEAVDEDGSVAEEKPHGSGEDNVPAVEEFVWSGGHYFYLNGWSRGVYIRI